MLHPGFCWVKRGKPWHSSPAIKVLIAHPCTSCWGKLAHLLEKEGDIKVVGRAANGLETPQAEWLSPDITIAYSGLLLGTSSDIVQGHHQSHTKLLVLALKGSLVTGYATTAGMGDIDSEELVKSIRSFHKRGFAPAANPSAKEGASQAAGIGLTAREEKILALVAQGMRDNQIASTLSLSPKTVRNRLSLLYRKLSINNRTQAVLWALRNLSGEVKQ